MNFQVNDFEGYSVTNSKWQGWINFCTQTGGIHESARFCKVLGRFTIGKLEMLRLPGGNWTISHEEAYTHLLETHFRGCKQVDDTLKQTPKRAHAFNSNEVQRIITENRIRWAFDCMSLFKTPGQDGIYPVLLQKGLQHILHPICCVRRASLSMGYIPRIWRETKVTFVPKFGTTDYTTAKTLRPIS